MMRTNEEYKEWIDSYLKGNLSSSETTQLKNDALTDKKLENEIHLQKTLLETLQASRKAELKQRLNKIDVSATGNQAWKYAAILCGFFATGLLTYYVTSTAGVKKEEVEVTQIPVSLQESTSVRPETKQIVGAQEGTPASSKEVPNESASVPQEVRKEPLKISEVSKGEEGVPTLPDVNGPEAFSHEPLNKEIVNPEHGMGKSSHLHSTVAGVEVVKSKKHKFHYRYFDNKLFLYGDFEAKTYEILELNTSKGQELYLKFENKYYDLEPNKTEISKLEIVKSKDTLKQLEKVQDK